MRSGSGLPGRSSSGQTASSRGARSTPPARRTRSRRCAPSWRRSFIGTIRKERDSMAHDYRADTIGSLLRPDYLLHARTQFEAGELAPADYKAVEDRAVDQVIAM